MVQADNKTKTYDQANPPLTYTISGLVNGDTAVTAVHGAPVLTTSAHPTSDVGSYPVTLAQGTLAATNYSFSLAPGTLTIVPASTTLTAARALIVIQPGHTTPTGAIVSARLTFGNPTVPVASQKIIFTTGALSLCTATTGPDGTASSATNAAGALALVTNGTYAANYAGALDFNPSSASGRLPQDLTLSGALEYAEIEARGLFEVMEVRHFDSERHLYCFHMVDSSFTRPPGSRRGRLR